jgi:hypothetical protein
MGSMRVCVFPFHAECKLLLAKLWVTDLTQFIFSTLDLFILLGFVFTILCNDKNIKVILSSNSFLHLFFLSMVWDYVPELRAPTGPFSVLQFIYEYGETRWNDTDRGKPNISESILSQFHFVHHKSHMDWPVHEPGIPRWKACD